LKVSGSKQSEEDHQAEVHSMTEQMLESAKRGDWDVLISQEENRQSLIKKAFGQRKGEPIETAAAEQQADLMRGILTLDHQTRDLIEKQMYELSKRFDREKKIAEAYGYH